MCSNFHETADAGDRILFLKKDFCSKYHLFEIYNQTKKTIEYMTYFHNFVLTDRYSILHLIHLFKWI